VFVQTIPTLVYIKGSPLHLTTNDRKNRKNFFSTEKCSSLLKLKAAKKFEKIITRAPLLKLLPTEMMEALQSSEKRFGIC